MRTTITRTIPSNDEIIYSLSLGDLEAIKRYLNSSNVNSILSNSLTSLQCAIKFGHDHVIKYLLEIGADPYIKTINSQNSFDLSIMYHNKTLIIETVNKRDKKVSDLENDIKTIQKKLTSSENTNHVLTKTIDDANTKLSIFKEESKVIKSENSKLKINISLCNTKFDALNTRYNDLSQKNAKLNYDLGIADKAFIKVEDKYSALEEEHNSLKRKHSKLEESFDGLLKKQRK
jgi:ankyrin repeat protein